MAPPPVRLERHAWPYANAATNLMNQHRADMERQKRY